MLRPPLVLRDPDLTRRRSTGPTHAFCKGCFLIDSSWMLLREARHGRMEKQDRIAISERQPLRQWERAMQ